MSDLVVHILASYAVWFAVTQSELPWWGEYRDRLRVRYTSFSTWAGCPMCSGFWCSLLVVLLRLAPSFPLAPLSIGYAAALSLAGASGVFLLETLVRRFEAR